jgi:tetratricopeptide (TPR) repeat protein
MIEWYGKDFMTPHYGEIIYEAVNLLPGTENKLFKLAFDTSQNIIARASALQHLQNFPSPIAQKAVEIALLDNEPIIRLGAIEAARPYNMQDIYNAMQAALNDSIRSIRVIAGELISPYDVNLFPGEDQENITNAVSEYIYNLRLNGDRPLALSRIGIWHMQHQRYDSAEYFFKKALKDYPLANIVYVNLAELERLKGNDHKAIDYIKEGLKKDPELDQLNHSMGLFHIRKKEYDSALIYLAKASENHADPHHTYVYAIALNSTNKSSNAIEVLKDGLSIHPYNVELLFALASIYRDMGNFSAARKQLEVLQKIRPWDPGVKEFLEQLK